MNYPFKYGSTGQTHSGSLYVCALTWLGLGYVHYGAAVTALTGDGHHAHGFCGDCDVCERHSHHRCHRSRTRRHLAVQSTGALERSFCRRKTSESAQGFRRVQKGLEWIRWVLPSAFTVSSCAAAVGLSSSDIEEEDDVAMDKASLFRFRADVAQLSRYLEKEKHNPP